MIDSGKLQLLSQPKILGLLLGLVTLCVFWPAKDFDFLGYDDPGYFSENPHILGGVTAASVAWAFTSGDAANWHPFTWLSLMLDAEIFGHGPAGPHLTNLLLHAANAVLLLSLLLRLTGARWRSLLVAALFALHPLHVESVAWISERKDVLSLFFELLALLAYVRWAQRGACGNSKFGIGITHHASPYNFPALIFFTLALMSKPMAVTMPFLLLLLDFWPLNRIPNSDFRITLLKSLIVEKIPFFALSALACVITFIVQKNGGTVATLDAFPLGVRMENALVSYARYLEKMFWPTSLANPYPHPGHWPVLLVLGSITMIAVVCAVAIHWRVSRRYFFTGWFWFLGTLVPVIGLVQVGNQAMADRYSYLPLIGIFIALVWLAAELAAKQRLPQAFVNGCVLLLLTGLAMQTRAQLKFWPNDGTLFGHAIAVTEKNFTAEINLGAWLSKNGAADQALICYSRALQIKPTDAVASYNVGNIFLRMGDTEEAERRYRAALKERPDYPEALSNLGLTLARQKKYDEAATNLLAALKAKPDFADALNNLGTVRYYQGQHEESARCFGRALELSPDNLIYLVNTGDALARIGQKALAAGCYAHALQLQPDNQKIHAKLDALAAATAPASK